MLASGFKKSIFAISLLMISASITACDDDSPVCGNGIVEKGEECDDGNLINTDGCTNQCMFPPYQSSKVTVRWYLNGTRDMNGTTVSYDTCTDLNLVNTRVMLYGPQGLIEDKTVLCSSMTYTISDSRDAPFQDGLYYARLAFYDSQDATVSTVFETDSVQLNRHGEVFLDVVSSLDDFTAGPYMGTFYFELSWNGGTCEDAGVDSMRMTLSTSDGSQVASMEGKCMAGRNYLEPDVSAGDGYVLDVVGYTTDGTAWGCLHQEDIKVGAGITNPSYVIDVTPVGDSTDSTGACE